MGYCCRGLPKYGDWIAPAAPAGHSELEPLNLDKAQLAQLVAFLRTLSGPLSTEATWLQMPAQ
jgi:hypothetical protein